MGPTLEYPIRLLTDFHPKGKVARLYGLYNEERGTANRAVVIIDTKGIVRFRRLYTSLLKSTVTGQEYVDTDLKNEDILAEVDKINEIERY